MKQHFTLSLPKIHMQVEGGKGLHTVPLILCDIGLNGALISYFVFNLIAFDFNFIFAVFRKCEKLG